VPDVPAVPDVAATTDVPAVLDVFDVPDVPAAPDVVDVPDVPAALDVVDVPDVVDVRDVVDVPAASDAGAPNVDGGACVVLAAGETYNLNITAHPVTVRTTSGGVAVTDESASLILRDPVSGDSARLASISVGQSAPIGIVPGTYDLYYQAGFFPTGAVLPVNTNGLIRRGVRIERPTDLVVDIPRAHVTGRITSNGRPGGHCVALINPVNGDRADLDVRTGGLLDAFVLPGTYDLHSESCATTATTPPSPILRAGIVVAGDTTIDVALNSATLRGSLVSPPPAILSAGYVELHESLSGQVIDLGTVHISGVSAGYTASVPFGTYDVFYASRFTGMTGNTVGNSLARLATGLRVDGDRTYSVSVPSVAVSFRATLLGRALVAGQGGIYFRNGEGSASVATVGTTSNVRGLIVPGTYDMMWSGPTAPTTGTLRNQRFLLRAGVTLPGTVDPIDVTPVALTGTVTRNGAPPTFGFGQVSLERVASEDRPVIANVMGTNPYSVLLMPGTYDLVYAATGSPDVSPGSSLLRNRHAVLRRGISITAATTLDIDLPASLLRGVVTLNGVTGRDGSAYLFVRRAGDAADTARLTTLPEAHYTSVVVPGTYEVFVGNSNPTRPSQIANTNGRVGCVVIP